MKRHPTNKFIVVCGFSKSKDMSSILHFLATNSNVKEIYPVTSYHTRLSPIETIQEKINCITKLLQPYDTPCNPFKEPIDKGSIPSTLRKVTA